MPLKPGVGNAPNLEVGHVQSLNHGPGCRNVLIVRKDLHGANERVRLDLQGFEQGAAKLNFVSGVLVGLEVS